jgi:hypothetical protein
MKKLIAALCFMFAVSPLALAQDIGTSEPKKAPAAAEKPKKEPSEKQKAQQERMSACSAKAGERKGDERKKFMSSCLKGEDPTASPKQKGQQDKMKSCNKDAGEKKLKGDERKKFMSDCLKG